MMDKRLVTWIWFSQAEIDQLGANRTRKFPKLLAERLRKAADEIEAAGYLNISPSGNVNDQMGSPFGYFETQDEAKKFTR